MGRFVSSSLCLRHDSLWPGKKMEKEKEEGGGGDTIDTKSHLDLVKSWRVSGMKTAHGVFC